MSDPIKVRIFLVSHYIDIEVFGAEDEADAQKQAIAVFNREKPKTMEVTEPTILALTWKSEDDLPEGEAIH